MTTNTSSGVTDAYIVNVAKQFQINGVPLGTADLANTANFTTAATVQSDFLQPDSNSPRYIRNKPLLAAVATSGSAADLTQGVLPLSTIPQLPAPTISSGNFQIGSFAVDVIPTVDSAQNLGKAGASWNTVVARNLAVNKSSASTALDLVGQATFTGSTIPQVSVVNPSTTADGTQPAVIGFDCTAQGAGQAGALGFATTRGIFARIAGVDRLNISTAGNTTISGSLTGVNTAAHQLGNLLISDYGKSTSTVQFAGIGNAVAGTPSAALLMPADGSVRINAGGNASVSFQSRYSTNVIIDSTGNIYPNTTNAQFLGLSNLAWGTVNTATLNCTQQMNYQGKALQPIATSGSAADLTTGVAPLARIPNLPAGQITYGTYTVGSFATEVDPSLDFLYNLGNTTTRWKDINAYSLDIKGYTSGGNNLGLNCGGPVSINNGFGITVHDQTAASNAGNATIKSDVFQSYYDPSAHTFGTSYTGCSDGYDTTTALWRHKDVGQQATSNAASNISTVYALKQSNLGVTTLNAATSRSVNLSIANVNQVVLTPSVLRPATNAALDLGSTSYYYRNLYSGTATLSGGLTVGGGTTQTGLVSWPSTGTSSGLTWGPGPYSKIVDDGDLRISTDDNMHFYTGLSSSGYGTELLTLSAAGVTVPSTVSLTAPKINLPQASGFTGYGSQLNNNLNWVSSGSNAYFNQLNVNQSAPGLFAGCAIFTAANSANVGFGANGIVQMASNGSADVLDLKQNAASGKQIVFFTNSGPAGIVSSNGTSTSYGTSSDYRLKENVVSIVDCEQKINALRPVQFTFKADGGEVHEGFIAHEIQAVLPRAVLGVKDAVDDDNRIMPQAVDLAKVVPVLVATVQSLLQRVHNLESSSIQS